MPALDVLSYGIAEFAIRYLAVPVSLVKLLKVLNREKV
jgi:hypothetical protein